MMNSVLNLDFSLFPPVQKYLPYFLRTCSLRRVGLVFEDSMQFHAKLKLRRFR